MECLIIAEDIIQKVKDLNDIVDIVSEKVKLKRTGRNYSGLCPFHHEKTPSFSVSQDKQIYKCFGCGEAGNVITFVMKTKNFSFVEAVKYLADKVNITIDDNKDKYYAKNKEKYDKLYSMNVEAARYFFRNLDSNSKAKKYFLDRGINQKTMRRFGLGYAKDDWRQLLSFMKSKGYTELELIEAGLIVQKNKAVYDRFRNRVIFPVFDYKGKVIGFGGRVLDDSKPKYLNSPETKIFKKGTNLYGLNFAVKNNIGDTIIIVEGYMDCISLHQYGINNVVASLGTALTKDQAKLLKRYASKVVISYDADTAGQAATLRGFDILREAGFDIKIIKIPDGKDPDEFVRKNGKEAFMRLVENAVSIIDYRINRAFENVNLKDSESVIKYVKDISEIIEELDPVEKDVYIKKISDKTGIREQAIYDLISTDIQKSGNNIEKMNKNSNYGQNLYVESAHVKSERYLLRLMIEHKDIRSYIESKISADDLIMESHKKIYNIILNFEDNLSSDLKSKFGFIESRCDDGESSSEIVKIEEQNIMLSENNVKDLVDDFITNIKKFRLEESKKKIMSEIKGLEEKGLFDETIELIKRMEEIQNQLDNL
ncbi:DNA primase [Clostridium acetobutylicum]|uniref:DNA primase n=1 Tax=Clostridium acetobutylicum (strain ATCC 824 / DSM 792 / JCM 1419 / IAM 19013 / LMG 5710 / NBRC 13948 / NRRL B-527 / VKM B-1787 / 2291 / W) TaxID=272562 RepID=DNAG_CLOAB|nr:MULTISPECIES: DNA primase [Clostridium]P33655.1 RecName: Full=DNA primase [Clostridium acetobutylicum ATCC 824]AAK79270.1 DNA primase, DNAG [Clostridium acetobutylicum ATCC 824]ADZ20349.1 DNA primase [Clostridium acetobutylicum EA 2018]AEI33215.1 DNA primase [Clostridium acetobutylicum DSM 1731]AWV81483.1 DNA primase [Clostridium acetobutylicum]MBC2393120.1 DNA primase [Clostridium acetobutylicum]